MRRCGFRVAAAGLAVLMSLAGCSPAGGESPSASPSATTATPTDSPSPLPSPTPPSTPSPSPSPSPTFSPEQQAAVDAVETYFAASQVVRKDLEAEFQPVADVTTDRFLRFAVEDIAMLREEGQIQVGDRVVMIQSVTDVLEDEQGRWITVEVCTDSTGVDIVDAETRESVLGDDRIYFMDWEIGVWDVDGRWLLGDGKNERSDSCDAT